MNPYDILVVARFGGGEPDAHQFRMRARK